MIEAWYIWMAIGAAVLIGAAEWLHAQRTRRIARLAFPLTGSPRAWTVAAPLLRSLAGAGVTFGLLVLLAQDGRPASGAFEQGKKTPDKHLIIAMDVSPSMFLIKDGGPSGQQTRRERARDVLQSLLTRLDMTRTRITVIAFWDEAKPVAIDTFDVNIALNAIGDLPLHYAFKGGKTDLNAGVREAARIASAWAPGSTTLVVVSDGGDIISGSALPSLPQSIGDSLVLGVGSPFKSSPVAETYSRQERESLDRLAVRVRGEYYDANSKHLPSATLRSLKMLNMAEEQNFGSRTIALICLALGSVILAALSPALGLFGAALPRRRILKAAAPTVEFKPAVRRAAQSQGEREQLLSAVRGQ